MSVTVPSPPMTLPIPPSPCPSFPASETENSRLPSTPSTGLVWAELASLAVAAFTEPLISQLHAFIARTPGFEHAHLQMLGPIVVRHVAIMLQDMDHVEPPCCPNCQCQCQHRRRYRSQSVHVPNRSAPSNPNPPPPPPPPPPHPAFDEDIRQLPRRPSFRDIAYQAVRLNRILPASLADSATPSCDKDTALIRRLSITAPAHIRPEFPSATGNSLQNISSSPVQSSASPTPSDENILPTRPRRRHHVSASKLQIRRQPLSSTTLHPSPKHDVVVSVYPPSPPSPPSPTPRPPPEPVQPPPLPLAARNRDIRPRDVSDQPPRTTASPHVTTRSRPASNKNVNRQWRHQAGLPTPASRAFPRATQRTTVDVESAPRPFKFRSRKSVQRVKDNRPATPSPSQHSSSSRLQHHSRRAEQPIDNNNNSNSNTVNNNTSRLVILRRQRERRRSSLR